MRLSLLFASIGMGCSAVAGGTASAQVGHALTMTTVQSEGQVRALVDSAIPMEQRLPSLPPVALSSTPPPAAQGIPIVTRGAGGAEAQPAAVMPGQKRASASAAQTPHNYGNSPFGGGTNLNTIYHYTDNFVQASSQYPYRTAGHFAFTAADGKNYRCTAALISRAILATAGHCVHQGGNRGAGWIKSGYFVPARAGNSWPYGYAAAIYVTTTSGWYNQGNIIQGYDVALVVLYDRIGYSLPPGNYVGWLGFCVRNCLQPYWYLTQLGYPGNYYSGLYMTRGQHLETNRNNTDYWLGSGMQGGSSGGPHVANLGYLSDSTSNKGLWPYRNVLFAVTSWGYVSDQYKIQGASTTSGPGNSNGFIAMWNAACAKARQYHGNSTC